MQFLTFDELKKTRASDFTKAQEVSNRKRIELEKALHCRKDEIDSLKGQLALFEKDLQATGKVINIVKKAEDLGKEVNVIQNSIEILSILLEIEKIKKILVNKVQVKCNLEECHGLISKLKQLKIDDRFGNVYGYWCKVIDWAIPLVDFKYVEFISEALNDLQWPKPIEPTRWSSKEVALLLELVDGYSVFSSLCGDVEFHSRSVKVFIQSIRIHFLFHFSTARPTNRLDRPEWYLNHILQVIESHEPFITNCLELDTEGEVRLPISEGSFFRVFINELINMAAKHLEDRIKSVIRDGFILDHTFEEVLNFAETIYEKYSVKATRILNVPFKNSNIYDAWIDAEMAASRESYEDIMLESPSWRETKSNEEFPMITSFINLFNELMTTLIRIPEDIVKVSFLSNVIDPLLISLQENFEFEIPSFHDTMEDVHVHILQANSLKQLLNILEEKWGEDLEVMKISESEEFKRIYTDGEMGTVLGNHINSFKELYTKVNNHIFGYIWYVFHSPASSYARSMYYGVLRDQTLDKMSEDLRKALVSLVKASESIKPLLNAASWKTIEAMLLNAMQKFLFDQVILKNYFRPENIPQLTEDLQHIRKVCISLFLNQPIDLMFTKILEAKKLLSLPDELRDQLCLAVEKEDVEEIVDVLNRIKVSNISVGECSKILNLLQQ